MSTYEGDAKPTELTELLPGKHEWDSGEGGGGRSIGFTSPVAAHDVQHPQHHHRHPYAEHRHPIDKLPLNVRENYHQRHAHTSIRNDVWTILRFRSSVTPRSCIQRASYVFELCILTLIVLNVLVAMGISSLIDGQSPEVAYMHSQWYDTFLTISTIIFSVEYMLRLWSCVEDERFLHPILGRVTWMLRPMSVIDLVVLVPFYVELFFKFSLTPANRGLITLRALRLLRVLSFLRLERSYQALKNLRTILSKKKEELGLVTYMTAVVVLTASITIFFFENEAQPKVFSSIGVSAWWTVETITSLGYGDIVPITNGGRIFSSLLALWGIILFTIPGAVLSSGFVEVMLEREREKKDDAIHDALQRTLSHHAMFSMSASNLNQFRSNNTMDSPVSQASPTATAAASAQLHKLEQQLEQLTLMHEELQQHVRAQDAHLHAILHLLQASQTSLKETPKQPLPRGGGGSGARRSDASGIAPPPPHSPIAVSTTTAQDDLQ